MSRYTISEAHNENRSLEPPVLGLVLTLPWMLTRQPCYLTTMGHLPTPASKAYLVTFELICVYNIPRACLLNRSPVPAMVLKSNRSGLLMV